MCTYTAGVNGGGAKEEEEEIPKLTKEDKKP
jgi:hypothetical protein